MWWTHTRKLTSFLRPTSVQVFGSGCLGLVVLSSNSLRGPSGCSDQVPAPPVTVVRHAESVANVIKAQDVTAYYKRSWLDDSAKPPEERLRDCVLSKGGISASLALAGNMMELVEHDPVKGKILLIVSPLSRSLLTASLLFHRVAHTRDVCVVVDPAATEVLNEPHDLVENLGRPMDQVFDEARALLGDKAPVGALALLDKFRSAARHLDDDWWFSPTAADNLPRRVFESGMDARRERLRKSVQKHVSSVGGVTRVFIVTHWGILHALNGGLDTENLEMVEVGNFL